MPRVVFTEAAVELYTNFLLGSIITEVSRIMPHLEMLHAYLFLLSQETYKTNS